MLFVICIRIYDYMLKQSLLMCLISLVFIVCLTCTLLYCMHNLSVTYSEQNFFQSNRGSPPKKSCFSIMKLIYLQRCFLLFFLISASLLYYMLPATNPNCLPPHTHFTVCMRLPPFLFSSCLFM